MVGSGGEIDIGYHSVVASAITASANGNMLF